MYFWCLTNRSRCVCLHNSVKWSQHSVSASSMFATSLTPTPTDRSPQRNSIIRLRRHAAKKCFCCQTFRPMENRVELQLPETQKNLQYYLYITYFLKRDLLDQKAKFGTGSLPLNKPWRSPGRPVDALGACIGSPQGPPDQWSTWRNLHQTLWVVN